MSDEERERKIAADRARPYTVTLTRAQWEAVGTALAADVAYSENPARRETAREVMRSVARQLVAAGALQGGRRRPHEPGD